MPLCRAGQRTGAIRWRNPERGGELAATLRARAQAAYTLSAMAGALTMARMVDDPVLSDTILSEARKRLVDG